VGYHDNGKDESVGGVEERIKWAFHRQLNINTFYPDAGRGHGRFRPADGGNN